MQNDTDINDSLTTELKLEEVTTALRNADADADADAGAGAAEETPSFLRMVQHVLRIKRIEKQAQIVLESDSVFHTKPVLQVEQETQTNVEQGQFSLLPLFILYIMRPCFFFHTHFLHSIHCI